MLNTFKVIIIIIIIVNYNLNILNLEEKVFSNLVLKFCRSFMWVSAQNGIFLKLLPVLPK